MAGIGIRPVLVAALIVRREAGTLFCDGHYLALAAQLPGGGARVWEPRGVWAAAANGALQGPVTAAVTVMLTGCIHGCPAIQSTGQPHTIGTGPGVGARPGGRRMGGGWSN